MVLVVVNYGLQVNGIRWGGSGGTTNDRQPSTGNQSFTKTIT